MHSSLDTGDCQRFRRNAKLMSSMKRHTRPRNTPVGHLPLLEQYPIHNHEVVHPSTPTLPLSPIDDLYSNLCVSIVALRSGVSSEEYNQLSRRALMSMI